MAAIGRDIAPSAAATVLGIARQEDDFAKVMVPYREHLRFNIHSPRDASLFFLAERHLCKEIDQMKVDFVHFWASKGPVIVLSENVKSGMLKEEEEAYKGMPYDEMPYDERYRHNIKLVGWDLESKLRFPQELPQHVIEKLEKYEQELKREIEGYYREIAQLAPGLVSAEGELVDDLQAFTQVFLLLNEKDQIECVKFINLITLCKSTLAERQNYHAKLLQASIPISMEEIRESFPARTEAMVKTLQNIDAIKRQLGMENAKVVLMAGTRHLLTAVEHLNDPIFDLTKLYQEMERHSCISLIPAMLRDE